MATERGTTQDFNNHLFVILLSSLHEKMQSATHMHDPSLYNNLLTDTELRVVISCDITAVRRTDCRINVTRIVATNTLFYMNKYIKTKFTPSYILQLWAASFGKDLQTQCLRDGI